MMTRGIRGATTAVANTPSDIRGATRELIQRMVGANRLEPDSVASILFTSTPDLDAAFPATAVRELGWPDVPVIGATELAVPGSLERCIRILMHVNTDRPAEAMRHVYLGKASALRPDLAGPGASEETVPGVRRMAIIGLGQMGGSLAGAMRARLGSVRITGYDLDVNRARELHDRRLIHRLAGSAREAVRDADLIVLAVPVDETLRLIGALRDALAPGAILTDVASAKTAVARAVTDAGLARVWAGLHPMAGCERAGTSGHDESLFAGCPVALTPLPETEDRVISTLENLVMALGARCLCLEPEVHDQAVALVSHLPHVLAASLVSVMGPTGEESGNDPVPPTGVSGDGASLAASLAAGSFGDATRVAASDPHMVAAMLAANAPRLRTAISVFQDELTRFSSLLDDPVALRRELEPRARWRRHWRGWHTASPPVSPPGTSEQRPSRKDGARPSGEKNRANLSGRSIVPPDTTNPDGANR